MEPKFPLWRIRLSLQTLFDSLGLASSPKKDSPPAVEMVCLGILVNTEDLTLRVPDSRLRDLSDELQLWLSRERFTIKELQSLLGKLSFVTAFVHASQIFLSCLFNALWSFPSHTKHQPITLAMRQDLLWWNTFLPLLNGVSVIKPDEWSFANLCFSTNACMVRGERLALTNASRSLSQILLSRGYSHLSVGTLYYRRCCQVLGSRLATSTVHHLM